VGRLGQVVTAAARPHEHVVGQVARVGVGLVLGRREDAAERGDVLVVPRVAVGDGGAVGDARDLVAVVPPRHDARVLGGLGLEPEVGLAVVVDHDGLAVLQRGLEHDLRARGRLGHHVRVLVELLVAVEHERGEEHAEHDARAQALG